MSKRSNRFASEPPTLEEIREAFPIVFYIGFDYRKLDRMAGFWEAIGLETEVLTTGAGYALVLHHPLEAG